MREEKPVDDITVAVEPVGIASWSIAVTNKTDKTLAVVLDESTFATSEGESGGRLIKGSTRRIDADKPQPPIPIPPHATLNEVVLVEKFVSFEEHEAKRQEQAAKLDTGRLSRESTAKLGAMLMEHSQKARSGVSHLIVGGRLYLSIQVGAGKQTWSGVVEEAK